MCPFAFEYVPSLHFAVAPSGAVAGRAAAVVGGTAGTLGRAAFDVGAGFVGAASFGDALWWAVVTATTVGYGDVSPVTVEGRLIGVVLMLTGIGVIGVFTATVASAFFEEEKESELAADGRAARLD